MARFGELLSLALRSGMTVPAAERGSGIRMVNMGELFRYRRIPSVEMVRVSATIRDGERWLLRPLDLLFARRSLTLEGAGKCSVVWAVSEPTTWESSIIRARLDQKIASPEFYFYYFCSPQGRRQIETIVEQVAAAGIRLTELRDLDVPAPPVRAQRAIAEVLGALDDKIAANERVARTALELGDALFVAGLSSDETCTTIGELADRGVIEFGDGYRTKRSEHGHPGLRILRAGDVRDFQIFSSGGDFVSNDYLRQIGSKASRPGDIIMTTKGTVGRVAVVPPKVDQVVYSPQICYFRVTDHTRLDVGYLAAWFRSADLANQTSSLMYKSDMAPYINLRDVRSLSLPLPEACELRRQGIVQRALLDRFDACCVESQRLARTRDELLPLLMSGTVRVKDAEAAASEVL